MKSLLLVSVVVVAVGCGGDTKPGTATSPPRSPSPPAATTNPFQTYCFALFDDRAAAKRAAAHARHHGLATQVDRIEEYKKSIPTRWRVIFVSPKLGDDARRARRVYRQARRREGGVSGHGKTGCLERRRFT